jgi:hypothetical protein
MDAIIAVTITVTSPGPGHPVEKHSREIQVHFPDNPEFVAHELGKVAPQVLVDVLNDFGDVDGPGK